MKKILIAILFLFLVPNYVFACSQYDNVTECEDRTGQGCEWNQGTCVFNPANIQSSVEQGKISESLGVLDPLENKFDSIESIINLLLPYTLTLAGLVLLFMLIMGGFGMLTAGTDAKKAEAGQSRITAAIIGFIIIFVSYWIIQILEIVLGVKILSQ